MTTILSSGIEFLHQQTLMNGDYNKILNKAPHRYLDNMNLGYIPKYTKTSQLDCHTIRYNGTDETQDFAYPVNKLEIPPPSEYTNFNFAIDKHINRKLIDVSGYTIPNNEMNVYNNNKGISKFNSVRYIVDKSNKEIPKNTGIKYAINPTYRNETLSKRNDLIEVNDTFNKRQTREYYNSTITGYSLKKNVVLY